MEDRTSKQLAENRLLLVQPVLAVVWNGMLGLCSREQLRIFDPAVARLEGHVPPVLGVRMAREDVPVLVLRQATHTLLVRWDDLQHREKTGKVGDDDDSGEEAALLSNGRL